MTDHHRAPARSTLLRAASGPCWFGVLAWLVGVSLEKPEIVLLGTVFAAVGLGLVGAATARNIVRLRGGLPSSVAVAGVAFAGSGGVYWLLASTAALLGVPAGSA